MSFKSDLAAAANCPARTITVDAPELGEGKKARVKVMTLGERITFFAALDEARRKNDRGELVLPAWEQVTKVLHLVAAEADGTLSFTGPDDPDILKVPSPLAQRMIDAAVDACVGADSGAKKPSGGSGTRS